MRVQKFLSGAGVCSRRKAEEFVRNKKVTINENIAILGDKVTQNDTVKLENKEIVWKNFLAEKTVFIFYKPKGVETTLQKIKDGKSLADFNFGKRVFPVGRLDKDSHGILLMTDDGDFAHKMAHPSFGHTKEYIVKVDTKISAEIFQKFVDGTIILNGKKLQKASGEMLSKNLISAYFIRRQK